MGETGKPGAGGTEEWPKEGLFNHRLLSEDVSKPRMQERGVGTGYWEEWKLEGFLEEVALSCA